jgi:putative MFS transporter
MPESPRWLLLQGRDREAVQVVNDIAILNGKDPADLGLSQDTKICLEQGSSQQDEANESAMMGPLVLFSPALRMTTIGCILIMLSLHLMGFFQSFTPMMLDMKGVHASSKYASMLGSAFTGFTGVILAMLISTRVGRIKPMRICPFLFALACLSFPLADGALQTFCCLSFSALSVEFAYGLLNVYIPEVYPTEIRAFATGFTKSAGDAVALGVPITSAHIFHITGIYGLCIAYACLLVLAGIANCFVLDIETQGRCLADSEPSARATTSHEQSLSDDPSKVALVEMPELSPRPTKPLVQ